MFYFLEDFDIGNYADDSGPYCAGKNAESVVNNLEQFSTILFECLNNNYMILAFALREYGRVFYIRNYM